MNPYVRSFLLTVLVVDVLVACMWVVATWPWVLIAVLGCAVFGALWNFIHDMAEGD